jgi:hypothetical protein
LGLAYVALNPGASFRSLHDSPVNHLGNRDPRMLLCLHEEHAVVIAHGWAKVSGHTDGRRGAFQCGADACHDGGIQRLVRPRAAASPRRHRTGGCSKAAALDRLDPHGPSITARLEELGARVVASSPDTFRSDMLSEVALWERIVRDRKIEI